MIVLFAVLFLVGYYTHHHFKAIFYCTRNYGKQKSFHALNYFVLIRHVYSELRKLAQKKTSPTFVLADDPTAKPTADGPGAGVSGAEPQLKSFRCKLRNSLKLHLFTSHTPCELEMK